MAQVSVAGAAVALVVGLAAAGSPAALGNRIDTPYADARVILDALREDLAPATLRGTGSEDGPAAWRQWAHQRDGEIRARLRKGDDDSIANFLMYGLTFTMRPRAKLADVLAGSPDAIAVVQGRLDDLMAGLTAPGANERLQFARLVIRNRGLDPTTAAGRVAVRGYLNAALERSLLDVMRYDPRAHPESAAGPGAFRDRGLSTDTTLAPDYTIDAAIRMLGSTGTVAAGSVRRVAIVGPGLDFTDKYEEYDFYPQQTIQPFAVVDSLVRHGLAGAANLEVVTLDVSPRINLHLEAARRRAAAGGSYTLQLPRDPAYGWTPDLVRFWERFGDRIGTSVKAAAVPDEIGRIQIRAVAVRPAVVRSITSRDVNIVLQRLAQLPRQAGFDLVIATNVLVYYDVFEQSLALVNIARMLRPDGILLCNDPVVLLPGIPLTQIDQTSVMLSDLLHAGDRLTWYQRR